MQPRVTTLSSGLRVATDTMPDVASVSLGFYVAVGTRHEEMHQAGLSHLLEHMFFKGTPTRDVKALNRAIESVGGYLNAYTAREQTAYYARVLREDVPLALDLIADMMLNAKFDASDLEREKEVIAQEIGEAMDAPDDLVFDLLQRAAWPHQPIGLPVLGNVDTLAGITSEHLRAYVASHYRAENCVLTAAGAVEHEAFVALAEKLFADLPSGAAPAPVPAQYVGGDEVAGRKKQEQLHLCFGLKGAGLYDDDYYAQLLFSTALGGGSSSRLFHEVREERGLAYSISSSVAAYDDEGILTIYAACDPTRVGEAVPVILEELRGLVASITQEELDRAKALVRAGLLMELESTTSRAERLANHLLIYQRLLPLDETLGNLAAVTLEDVKRFGARVLASPLSRSAVGALAGLEAFEDTVARLTAA